jgi:hypothetical protein
VGDQVYLYVPGIKFSETNTATSCPSRLKIFKETNPDLGIENLIFVLELKGLG